MDGMMCKGGKTKVTVVPYRRKWFLIGLLMLIFCLCLFCSDARAVYQISNTGDSDVNGLYSSGSGTWDGNDFGNASESGWVIAIADYNNAYGVEVIGGSLTIDGDLTSYSTIGAVAGIFNAYGLYSNNNSITTDAINGTIYAQTEFGYAYGLYSGGLSSINIGDINGTISADANNGSYAYAVYSNGNMTIGDIQSGAQISANANDYAVGLASNGSMTTGDIRGTIDVHASGDYAYGILSYDEMNIKIDGGTVSAVADGGYNVAAIQSGRIFADALVTHDANDTVEIVAGSVIVGDIDLARTTDDDLLILSGAIDSNTTFEDDIRNVETINITGGTWYVNGNISDSNNGITMSGGVLGGTGWLCSLNVIDGTFAPGESIGTTPIDGNLTFGPDSTFEVDVNNSGTDYVYVTGTADLDGTIQCNVLGDERIRQSIVARIINANDGLSGEFDSVEGSTLFLIFSVEYDTDLYDVILNAEMNYGYYADTANQRSIGEAFNYIVGNSLDTGDMNDLLTILEGLPDGAAVNNAYNQMMPQDAIALPDITRKMMNQYNDSILDRMDSIRRSSQYAMLPNNRYLLASASNSIALPTQTNNWMPFVKGFRVWGDRDKESDLAGYDYTVHGGVAGMDKLVSDNSIFGFSFGGSMASVDYTQASTDADIDSFLCSLHGSFFEDDWHLDWAATYAHSWYESQRSIRFDAIDSKAKSEYQGDACSAVIEFGKNYGGTSMILEPIAGLGYTVVQQRSYKEEGADVLNLKVETNTTHGLYSKLGVRAATKIRPEENSNMAMVPKLNAFWIYDFADRVELSSSFIDGGSFKTEGQDPTRSTFNVGAGLNVYLSNNMWLFVDYNWQTSNDFNLNIAQVGAQWSF